MIIHTVHAHMQFIYLFAKWVTQKVSFQNLRNLNFARYYVKGANIKVFT